jgi:hypothetical protein
MWDILAWLRVLWALESFALGGGRAASEYIPSKGRFQRMIPPDLIPCA